MTTSVLGDVYEQNGTFEGRLIMADIEPLVLSMITCDRVVIDSITRDVSIRDVVHTISAYDYPARHPRLALFFELTNGHGEVGVCAKLVKVNDDDEVLQEAKGKIEFVDPRQIIAQALVFENIVFPAPGEYRFQLLGTDQSLPLLERRIVCRKIDKLDGGVKR